MWQCNTANNRCINEVALPCTHGFVYSCTATFMHWDTDIPLRKLQQSWGGYNLLKSWPKGRSQDESNLIIWCFGLRAHTKHDKYLAHWPTKKTCFFARPKTLDVMIVLWRTPRTPSTLRLSLPARSNTIYAMSCLQRKYLVTQRNSFIGPWTMTNYRCNWSLHIWKGCILVMYSRRIWKSYWCVGE